VREGPPEAEDEPPVVRRVQRVEALLERLPDRAPLHPAPQAGGAVARQHRLAVVEAQAAAEGDGADGAALLERVALGHLRAGRGVGIVP
jgi:hypothetical protein